MIKNKKILLICKERFSFPMYYLGKELEKNHNSIHYYFIHNTEVIQKNTFSRNTYFKFKNKIKKENLHDVKDLNFTFLKNRKNIKIDFNCLDEIEKKYTNFSSLNKQILSSQSTSTPYHQRFFFPQTSYEENIYWLILNYKNTENILDLIKPDYIFDLDNAEIQRTIINEVAFYKKIPYINVNYARYSSFIVPTFSMGLKKEKYFVEAFNANLEKKKINEYIQEVKKYREQISIKSNLYSKELKGGNLTYSYSFNFKDLIKNIISKTNALVISQVYYYKNNDKPVKIDTPLYTNPIKKIKFNYLRALRKFYLHSKFNKHFKKPEKEKYIYFPLHLIPESSTFANAPMYINELNSIEAVSKSLPISWKLYVKEHQSMIGERNLEFYKKVNKFHNVKVVQNNFYKDPKPWIENSLGVITITGSSAFEAAMLNKPAIVLGNVPFNVLENVKVASGLQELEGLLKDIKSGNWTTDEISSCAAYLKTINEVGVKLNLLLLMSLAEKKFKSQSLNEEDKETLNELLNILNNFYEKGIKLYNNDFKCVE